MPGGNSISHRPSGQTKPVRSVQTLLAATKDANKESKVSREPSAKRTHSEVSNEPNSSFDINGFINFQKDLDEIKFSLRDVTTKDDLNEVTKDLVKTSELEDIVSGIVKKLFIKFESSLEKKMNDKISKIQNDMEEKVESLSIENENLKKKLEIISKQFSAMKTDLVETVKVAKQSNISSNYYEQYSRKNNIKVFNFSRREKQNLRQDFINMVKTEMKVTLEERDVVAIHRLPAAHEPSPILL
ncbi:unnamed protein product [Mytilus coruscus]|uniref:Uncharacterized protein n=1 Tax=Mytilus coruscus TaxID=42192 RepID=A0A6J8A3K7_MYTCO|nr:unnamed protein product [Mytilus coruscus]